MLQNLAKYLNEELKEAKELKEAEYQAELLERYNEALASNPDAAAVAAALKTRTYEMSPEQKKVAEAFEEDVSFDGGGKRKTRKRKRKTRKNFLKKVRKKKTRRKPRKNFLKKVSKKRRRTKRRR